MLSVAITSLKAAAQMQLRRSRLCTALEEVVMMWTHVYMSIAVGLQSIWQTGFSIWYWGVSVCVLALVNTSGGLAFSEVQLIACISSGSLLKCCLNHSKKSQKGFLARGGCSVFFIFAHETLAVLHFMKEFREEGRRGRGFFELKHPDWGTLNNCIFFN